MDNDRRNHCRRWRKDDENYIREHLKESDCKLAAYFGRTVGAIRTIKHKIKKSGK